MAIVSSILVIFVLVTVIIPMFTTPMRRPRNMLRNYILRITPIGMNIDEVIHILDARDDFRYLQINRNAGFSPLFGSINIPPAGFSGLPMIGRMSVSTYLGTYRAWYEWFPLMEFSVSVFWGFDEAGNLIDIHTMKIGMS